MSNPKFERRHYQAIAEVLRECYPRSINADVNNIGKPWWNYIKKRMSVMFANDNPNFDWEKFEEACEP